MGKYKDLVGKRFGSFTVLRRSAEKPSNGGALWECLCDCGNVVLRRTTRLISGRTTHCGCKSNPSAVMSRTMRKHGATAGKKPLRIYKEWVRMKTCCYTKGYDHYSYYGGRGIGVCEEWRTNYTNFEHWAHSNGYADDLTLDRIDYNKDYSPENCRWVSVAEQQRNKRSNILVSVGSKTVCLAEACRLLNLPYGTIHARIRRGINPQDAISFQVGGIR